MKNTALITKSYFFKYGDFGAEITVRGKNVFLDLTNELDPQNSILVDEEDLYDLQDALEQAIEIYEKEIKNLKKGL